MSIDRKIIQVVSGTSVGLDSLVALCNDGTLWGSTSIVDGVVTWQQLKGVLATTEEKAEVIPNRKPRHSQ